MFMLVRYVQMKTCHICNWLNSSWEIFCCRNRGKDWMLLVINTQYTLTRQNLNFRWKPESVTDGAYATIHFWFPFNKNQTCTVASDAPVIVSVLYMLYSWRKPRQRSARKRRMATWQAMTFPWQRPQGFLKARDNSFFCIVVVLKLVSFFYAPFSYSSIQCNSIYTNRKFKIKSWRKKERFLYENPDYCSYEMVYARHFVTNVPCTVCSLFLFTWNLT